MGAIVKGAIVKGGSVEGAAAVDAVVDAVVDAAVASASAGSWCVFIAVVVTMLGFGGGVLPDLVPSAAPVVRVVSLGRGVGLPTKFPSSSISERCMPNNSIWVTEAHVLDVYILPVSVST